MEIVKYTIVFDSLATQSLTEAYLYLKNELPSAANGFKEELEEVLILLTTTPFIFEKDRFKKNNTGNYRAFIIYNFRITYKIADKKVIVLLVRHTSRRPTKY